MNKMLIVAKYTFYEIYKSKIMVSVLLLAVALALTTFVASSFTYGAPTKVALDFGSGVMSLSVLGISIFMGVTLISREIESRTLYMVLSRPISRIQFLIGRVLGMCGILLLDVFVLTVVVIALYLSFGGELHALIFWNALFVMLEAIITLVFVILISLVTTQVLAVIATFSFLIVGHSISEVFDLSAVKNNLFLEKLLKIFSLVIPDLEKINIKNFLVYNKTLAADYLLGAGSYALVYIFALLFLTVFIFSKKDFN